MQFAIMRRTGTYRPASDTQTRNTAQGEYQNMAQGKTYRLLRKADEPAIVDGWAIPQLGEILALPFDAVGSGKVGGVTGGMEFRARLDAKVVDAPDASDGSCQVCEVEIIVRRKAIDEHEEMRIGKAVAEQSKRGLASKLRKAEESQNNVSAVIGSFREGQLTQAQIIAQAKASEPKRTVADTVREMTDTLAAAAEFNRVMSGAKQLPEGTK